MKQIKQLKSAFNKINPLKAKWMNLKIFSILTAFAVGLVFCSSVTTLNAYENMKVIENMEGNGITDDDNLEEMTDSMGKKGFNPKKDCHNVLVRDGKKLYLYNNQKAKIPGVNPVIFENLEEYVEYVKWQRKMGRQCPVLYMRKTYDVQNKLKMRLAPDPLNEMGGLNTMPPLKRLLDSGREGDEYNVNMQSGYDMQNQNTGIYTPLDKKFHDKHEKSASPMDSNWGGEDFSRDIAENINREREAAMADRHAVTIKKPDPGSPRMSDRYHADGSGRERKGEIPTGKLKYVNHETRMKIKKHDEANRAM